MIKLTVNDLKLRYGSVEVLKGITLELHQGEILVLLGASGSGKTTLLRSIAGFERPYSGTIKIGEKFAFDDRQGQDVPTENRGLGLVFQSYALWPHKTVDQNIRYALKLRKLSSEQQQERSRAALEQLGLAHLRERYPHQLSGGQQQRVAVARALVYDPPVILMDEPLSNLDARLRDEAKAWLRTIIRERNLSAIMVTHDQAEALAVGDKIALLADGRLEQQGAPQEIYEQPRSLVTAEFFGSNNRLNGVVTGTENGMVKVEGAGWSLWGRPMEPVRVGEEAAVVIRSEAISLTEQRRNKLSLPLSLSMFAGERWHHLFEIDGRSFTAYGPKRIEPGTHQLSVEAEVVWVFHKPADEAGS
ncbi:ABC transporter ATP-binding protein [Pseudorhizobium pelagicum]|uniref:Lipase n=1 Tax=Pseudorhizobium pelagicum TaxID=1509405 RepID=A0A922T5L9_9HYPH|nr:ABC transporter ATP-binding protein [Pseudorhizobium pelagicum]KEQ03690.1 lipase [Pseudorhizobium pelagicum]KEQ08254.1 lipase [Pseudorhizobium pelagicum]